MDKQIEKVLELVDEVGGTDKMSLNEYVEFLDELIGSLEIRRDAANADLANM